MNINRRTAISGVGAALAASGLSVAATALSPLNGQAGEPLPPADVTTRLGEAMDEVSSLLGQWDPHFRAIINPDRDYWLQNRTMHVPMRTDALIRMWCDASEKCEQLWARVEKAKPGSRQRALRHDLWKIAYDEREEALSNMLEAIREDRRMKSIAYPSAAKVTS